VTTIDRDAARQLYKVRGCLETLVVAEFTENASEDQRQNLFSIADRLDTLAENDGVEVLVSVKNELYTCILEGSGNAVLIQLFVQINNRIGHLRRLSLSNPGRLPETQKEIRATVEAIRNRLPDIARQLAQRHVERAGAVVISSLDEKEA